MKLPHLRGLPLPWGVGSNKPLQPEAHYRQLSTRVVPPDRKHARSPLYWLLARSQYRVKPIPLAHVPAESRAAATELEASAWQPYRRCGHYVIPQKNGSLLIAWDQDAIEAAQAGFDLDDIPVLPEIAFQPIPRDGLSVRQGLEGAESLVIRDQTIVASQWWATPPSAQAWANFQRAASLGPEQRLDRFPEAEVAPWLGSPQGYISGQASSPLLQREIWIVAIAAFLLALPTLWYANDWRRYATAASASEAKLAATEQELNGLLSARGSALDTLGRVTRLNSLFNQPDSLLLFAEVSRSLATVAKPGTLQLTEWDWRERRLRMTLNATGTPIPATTLVKAMEATPLFRDVQANVDGARTTLECRVELSDLPVSAAPLATSPAASPALSPAASPTPGDKKP
ncbi:MAG: hypothetical protein JNM52_04560 [Betaproteobacteria bacterium]|nr:hypothetical protein [Betaproteobacteria bacterium]